MSGNSLVTQDNLAPTETQNLNISLSRLSVLNVLGFFFIFWSVEFETNVHVGKMLLFVWVDSIFK